MIEFVEIEGIIEEFRDTDLRIRRVDDNRAATISTHEVEVTDRGPSRETWTFSMPVGYAETVRLL